MKHKSQDLSKILNKYSDEWVALKPETTDVVAAGNNLKTVIEEARKTGVDTPVITRVPKDYGTYIL